MRPNQSSTHFLFNKKTQIETLVCCTFGYLLHPISVLPAACAAVVATVFANLPFTWPFTWPFTLDWVARISKLDRPNPLSPLPRALLSFCNSIMSLAYWAQACSAASSKPLQALLDNAHASCGVTVSVGCSC